MTQRDTNNTIAWYKANEVWPGSIGFDPDGMCLKICRTARNIGPAFLSAIVAQNATPTAHRVRDVAKIRRGMVVYYDDANDSNPFGHIVTVVGRDPERDPNDLGSLFVRTNSVKANQIVVVRGDYFGRFWGDPFQFAATWLNHEVLDLPEVTPKPEPKPPLPAGGVKRLRRQMEVIDQMIANHKEQGHTRLARALRRERRDLRLIIEKFGRRER